jgi:hypothetical protein
MTLGKEAAQATKMLTFLKRMKNSRKQIRGRYINTLLSSMQLFGPMLLQISLIVSIVSEPNLSQIIKAFATLGFIVLIDDMFANNLPAEVHENAEKMNEMKLLKLGKDHNSFKRIFRRIWRSVSC